MSQNINKSTCLAVEEGIIGFDNLCIPCVIGIHPHERTQEQKIHIDLRVSADFAPCVETDSLENAIDYELLAKICTDMARTNQYKLLETLAWEILDEILDRFPIFWASIVIKKDQALSNADRSIVELKKRKI
jgi:FolB domain-containing protein